jgi:hypothetical protein
LLQRYPSCQWRCQYLWRRIYTYHINTAPFDSLWDAAFTPLTPPCPTQRTNQFSHRCRETENILDEIAVFCLLLRRLKALPSVFHYYLTS